MQNKGRTISFTLVKFKHPEGWFSRETNPDKPIQSLIQYLTIWANQYSAMTNKNN